MKIKIVFFCTISVFLLPSNRFERLLHEDTSLRSIESFERYLCTRDFLVQNYNDNFIKGTLPLYKEIVRQNGSRLIFSGIMALDIQKKLEAWLVAVEYRVVIFAELLPGRIFRKNYYLKMESDESLAVADEVLDSIVSYSGRVLLNRSQE